MMTHNRIKARYEGVQTFLAEGCYFLSLMSIVEEVTGEPHDLLSTIAMCKAAQYVTDDAYVKDALGLLRMLTQKKWTLKKSKELPEVVPDNMYTIQKWARGKVTHFRRRYVDTLICSATVMHGELQEYYLFSHE